jgi:hypothetical protein
MCLNLTIVICNAFSNISLRNIVIPLPFRHKFYKKKNSKFFEIIYHLCQNFNKIKKFHCLGLNPNPSRT